MLQTQRAGTPAECSNLPEMGAWSADEFAVGLARLTLHGAVLEHNAYWAQLLGPMVPGTELRRYVHPEDAATWQQLIGALTAPSPTAQLASERGRFRFVPFGKGLCWLELSVRLSSGHVWVAVHDVTPSQRQFISSQADVRSLRGLIDGLPGLVYRGRNDRDWTMEVISQGCLVLTGYPAEDMRNGRHVKYSNLIVPEDVDYVWDSVQDALRRHQPYTLAYRIHSADGRLRHVLEKGQGVYSASGEVLAIEGTMYELPPEALTRLATLMRPA
ncbi:PAS domain-containing protein (plasmid) [Cupriavidus metallidurans]|uniref:PAS domain-containing protein n=1 Tax=Cupriavidus metallidurans TaxID=119219 RepID=UPI003D70FF58